MNLKRLSQFASPIFGLVLFGLSLWAINLELKQYNYRDVLHSLGEIPKNHLLLALVLTFLNYLMLTAYDTLGMHYVRHRLPYRKIALTAVITYAISNTIGFALLTGSAIRYRLYSTWGLSALKITNIVAFCNLSFWLGLFTVSGVMFLVEPMAVPSLLHLPFASVQPIGAIFLLLVVGYLVWNTLSRNALRIGKLVFPHLSTKFAVAQIVVASLDWTLAASILYALLPSSSLSFPGFFGIYLLAQIAALISNVPGGLGVFETIIILLLSPPISSPTLLGALLAYRGIYYFLPLIVAVLLLGIYELRQRKPTIPQRR